MGRRDDGGTSMPAFATASNYFLRINPDPEGDGPQRGA